MSDFFRFEDENIDFPFYNGKPLLSLTEWIVLLVGVLAFIGILIVPVPMSDNLASLLLCLAVFVPSMYVCRKKFELLFRKPKRKDIKIIIGCLLAYYLFSMLLISILEYGGMASDANAVFDVNMDLMFWIMTSIQLLGEELFKISVFLIMLHLFFKITSRKLSIIFATVVTLLVFGLLHYTAYSGALVHIIVVIGFGGIFYFYAYLKTKNVVVSYIVHFLIDAIPFLISMMVV